MCSLGSASCYGDSSRGCAMQLSPVDYEKRYLLNLESL
jgi:hypothetical protein